MNAQNTTVPMKGITCCGDCIYYNWRRKKCRRGNSIETNPRDHFFEDCPLPDAVEANHHRLLTLDEVIAHYSLPSVYFDDLSMQEDYLNDIEPLYFEYEADDPLDVHWRNYQSVAQFLKRWAMDGGYGKSWRCWTGKPSEKQMKEAKWDG